MANLDDLEVDLQDGQAAPRRLEEDADVDDAPVVKYVQKILLDAITGGASDIHFEPYEKFYRIRYRIDGILYDVAQPPLAIKDKVASRIKVVSRLDISEKRVPQDGRMKLVLSKTQGDRLPRLDAADALRREDRACGSSTPRAPRSASRRWATSRTRRSPC